jgi:hypothetical protein
MRLLKIILTFLMLTLFFSCKQAPTEPAMIKNPSDYFPLSINNKWYFTFTETISVSGPMIVDGSERWDNKMIYSGTRTWEIIKSTSYPDSENYTLQDLFTGIEVWSWGDTSHQSHYDTTFFSNASGTFTIIYTNNDTLVTRKESGFADFPYFSLVPSKRHNDPTLASDTITTSIPTSTTMPGNNLQKIALGKGLVYYTYIEGRVWFWKQYLMKLDSSIVK